MPKTKATAITDPMEDFVDCTAPLLAGRARQDILLSVNGETVRIRRGETVRIKRKFLEVLENAQRQERAAHKAMALAQAQSDRALAAL